MRIGIEEKVTLWFPPDTLVPEELHQIGPSKMSLEPEMALMLAVLEDAITCFRRHVLARGGKEKRQFREAEKWIMESDSEWLFSFENICEAVGLSPRFIRKGLLRWKAKSLTQKCGAQIVPFEVKRREIKKRFPVLLPTRESTIVQRRGMRP